MPPCVKAPPPANRLLRTLHKRVKRMRCFFHLRETGGYIPDEEGIELPDLAAVRAAAVEGARSTIAHEATGGRLPLATVMEVEDEGGVRLFDLPFRDTVVLDG